MTSSRRCLALASTAASALAAFLASAGAAAAQQPAPQPAPPSAVLINDVRIFDGTSDQLKRGNLLIEGRKIARISSAPIAAPPGATVIAGGGRVLMPGLTDAHWHMTMAATPYAALDDPGMFYALTVVEARKTLLRGFTTVRDVAGPTFGVKRAIDAGIIPGPRVYPSGALISQTAGHGDATMPWETPKALGGRPSRAEELGLNLVADGPTEVLAAVRLQRKQGASQVKLAGGGGVVSTYDPLDVTQYSPEEMRAAVEAADEWGTYVALHVYTPKAIRAALEAGIKSIEHAQLIDEPTIALMAEKGAWLSTQPWEQSDFAKPAPGQTEKGASLNGAWRRVVEMARKHHVRVAFGTDLLFDPDGTYKQNVMLTRLAQVYSNVEVLKIATSGNCELFAMSGPRNPYKEAKLGVLEEGAWADMLLVDGDPTQVIDVLRDFEKNFRVIIKDGAIYKNTLK